MYRYIKSFTLTDASQYLNNLSCQRSVDIKTDDGKIVNARRYVDPDTNDSFALIPSNGTYAIVKISKSPNKYYVVDEVIKTVGYYVCRYIKHPAVDTTGVNQERFITDLELKKKPKSKAEQLMLMVTKVISDQI